MTVIGEARPAQREISIAGLAWLALGSLFVLIRVAGLLSIPVGGAELDALAGSWQAHAGNTDSRFFPTLLQGLSAATFSFTTSETTARVLVVLASCSTPLALYRLRRTYGEPAALATLLLLAFDPASVLFSSTATASGFDVPIVLWLAVLDHEPAPRPWMLAGAGFAAATAGGIVLPFAVALAGIRLVQQDYPQREATLWAAGGAIAGVVVASIGFGFGWEGLVVPPVAVFGAGFDQTGASEHTRYLALLYSTPLIAGALAVVAVQAFAGWRDRDWGHTPVLLFAWFGAALLWLIAAGGSHDPAPLVALAIPAALLIGTKAANIAGALQRVEWGYAAPVLCAVVLGAAVIEAYVVDWARVDRPGSADDKLIVAGLCIAAIAVLGILGSNRRTVGATLVPALLLGGLLMVSGTSAVAFGSPSEPLPSPISTRQGAEIRAIAVAARAEHGGAIVVHPSFEDAMTWALRDSGDIVVASRLPEDATVAIWPASEPAPEGYSIVDGQWSLVEIRRGPDGGFLDYLRWLSNRNSLKNAQVPLAVYLKAGQ